MNAPDLEFGRGSPAEGIFYPDDLIPAAIAIDLTVIGEYVAVSWPIAVVFAAWMLFEHIIPIIVVLGNIFLLINLQRLSNVLKASVRR